MKDVTQSTGNPGYAQFRVGYGHASLIDSLRPDVAYPGRRVKAARSMITTIFAKPCHCPDEHVEVWVRYQLPEHLESDG